jgi:hypothetical protein
VKIELAKLRDAIPRNAQGDPAFRALHQQDGLNRDTQTVLDVFTAEEVVELVNRALYQLEYQAQAHGKYAKIRRDKEKAIRQALKDKTGGKV